MTSSTKKTLYIAKWIIVNGLFAAISVEGIVYHTHWALNVARFLVWVGVAIYTLLVIASETNDNFELPELKVPIQADMLYDFLMASLFAAGGYFFYAALMLLSIILYTHVYKDQIEGLRSSAEQE